jgi:protein kinase C substrate 80K-H
LVENGFLADNRPKDGGVVSRALQRARHAHQQATTETSRLRNEIKNVEDRLVADYGPDDVFRAIDGDCASVDTGEYTYTVCVMGNVNQRSNKDGTTSNLGYNALFSVLTSVPSRDLRMTTRR